MLCKLFWQIPGVIRCKFELFVSAAQVKCKQNLIFFGGRKTFCVLPIFLVHFWRFLVILGLYKCFSPKKNSLCVFGVFKKMMVFSLRDCWYFFTFGLKLCARSCWKIGLDSRQLGLVSEEGQIVDQGKKENFMWSLLKTKNKSNNSLAKLSYKKVTRRRLPEEGYQIIHSGLLQAPTEDFCPWYALWENWKFTKNLRQWQCIETIGSS